MNKSLAGKKRCHRSEEVVTSERLQWGELENEAGEGLWDQIMKSFVSSSCKHFGSYPKHSWKPLKGF